MSLRKLVLRANAVWLGGAGLMALFTFDIAGIFFGKGPLATLGAHVPQAGIGFMEAHGLAIIIAVLMWRAATAPTRDWHLAGAAVHVLLGTCNLIFWDLFVSTGTLVAGYVTTALHWVFVVLQLLAASGFLGRTDARRAISGGAAGV